MILGGKIMDITFTLQDFEGPLDLLLHLIKQSNIDIFDIKIEDITKQYLEYITKMEELNLNIASEYLIMAAELIEMKSSVLLPRPVKNDNDDYEEDPREQLINRLLEYKQYKELSKKLKDMEEERKEIYTKVPMNQKNITEEVNVNLGNLTLDDLMAAFQKFLLRKEAEKPLHTKVTTKEYSINLRSEEIRSILRKKKKIEFTELFESYHKDYIVVTFLSILDLAKKQELSIEQNHNFEAIYLIHKGSDQNE